ncbi:unnamed protein product [Effrenium voratum]|nr:unnamed protein product [Effrenium voratum]
MLPHFLRVETRVICRRNECHNSKRQSERPLGQQCFSHVHSKVPITASTSTWDSNADSFLVAYCFAWYSPPKESFPNPHEDRLRWMCRQSLKDLCLKQGLGLGFAREVLEPLQIAERLIDKQLVGAE